MNYWKSLRIGTTTACLLLGGAAQAQDPIIAGWMAPNYALSRVMHADWAESVRQATGGSINFEVIGGGALMPATGALPGVASGLTQVGHIAVPYYPSELPVSNLAGNLGFLNPDPLVLSAAYADFIMNEAPAREEWQRAGAIFGSGASTPAYYLMCDTAIGDLDDLTGLRVRSGSGGWASAAEALGMIPVNIPVSELFTALERGAVDCVMSDLSQLTSGAAILELTKSVVLLPFSPGFQMTLHAYNPDFWKSLSVEQRRILWNESALAMARLLIAFDTETADALQKARDKGVSVIEPTEAMITAYAAWRGPAVEAEIAASRDRIAGADAAEVAATFQKYLDKWAGLIEGIARDDEAAIAAVLRVNLFDPLDPATHAID